MRKLFGLVAVAAIALSGSVAQAAAVQFTGSVAVAIATLPPIAVTGSGTLTLNGSGGLGHLSSVNLGAGEFAGGASIPVTDPGAFPIGGVKASVTNGAGSFALGGVMPIIGTANVCLFGACNASVANVNVPFTQNGTRGIGIGGGPITVGFLVTVTVQGAPWTTGVASIGTVSQAGFVHGPASGGASSAAANSGVIRLVSPVVINTNIGASPILPAFALLTLHFIPEPGTLLLLASGAVGLGILGRKRMSK